MIKVYCDRCGKEITGEAWFGYISVNFRKKPEGEPEDENPFEKEDFCMDCMSRIVAFIANAHGKPAAKRTEKEAAGTDRADTEGIREVQQDEGAGAGPARKMRAPVDYGKLAALLEAGWKMKDIAIEMRMTESAVRSAADRYRKKQQSLFALEPAAEEGKEA